ncbi:putative amidase domain protein [Microbacterium azadirachtae]|uniref:Putative amidase domain protein n=1 Tax=Microbacterium azadirachtae TaxID=582680 RepID=A0A0F0KVE1_9MICO|nr:amidase domain-containing protein [Microbacterium azadirachtae]KJL24877.1 putative amidase domain protein [Microbacterium azadirachtae]
MKRSLRLLLTAFAAAVALAVVGNVVLPLAAPSARAASNITIRWTHIGIFPRAAPSMSAAHAGAAVADGTTITVACEGPGDSVTSDVTTSTIWERTVDGKWYPNAFTDTGHDGWTPGIPRCDSAATAQPPRNAVPSQRYNRTAAVDWAKAHWNDSPRYDEDCTWFISQALWVGGVPKDNRWTDSSWDWSNLTSKWTIPGPTKPATLADNFKSYMRDSGKATVRELKWNENQMPDAQIGDIIGYDWGHLRGKDLIKGADGILDHLMIITSIDNQYPNVTGHTANTQSSGWTWSKGAGDWWEKAYRDANGNPPRVYLIHVNY